MSTLEYTWDDATIGMGLGENDVARGWTIVFALDDAVSPVEVTVVSLRHHGEPVEVRANHQTYWAARFAREKRAEEVGA